MAWDAKRALSATVVGIGVAFGILILLGAPMAILGSGVNDSWAEIIAMAALIISLLPASVLAIYQRRQAGKWLTAVGILTIFGFLYNNFYVASRTGASVSMRDAAASLLYGLCVVGYGLFLWITGRLGWHELAKARGVWNTERIISLLMCSLGSAYGIWLWLGDPSMGLENGWIEKSAKFLLLFTMLPASLLALLRRKLAGQWLTLLGLYLTVALVRSNFTPYPSTDNLRTNGLLAAAIIGLSHVGYGVFLWITNKLGWSEVVSRAAATPEQSSQTRPV